MRNIPNNSKCKEEYNLVDNKEWGWKMVKLIQMAVWHMYCWHFSPNAPLENHENTSIARSWRIAVTRNLSHYIWCTAKMLFHSCMQIAAKHRGGFCNNSTGRQYMREYRGKIMSVNWIFITNYKNKWNSFWVYVIHSALCNRLSKKNYFLPLISPFSWFRTYYYLSLKEKRWFSIN